MKQGRNLPVSMFGPTGLTQISPNTVVSSLRNPKHVDRSESSRHRGSNMQKAIQTPDLSSFMIAECQLVQTKSAQRSL